MLSNSLARSLSKILNAVNKVVFHCELICQLIMRQAVHYLSDVISIVFASVVGSYKGDLEVVQCLMHSQSLGVLGYLLEKFLYIDMLIAHWVRQFPKGALLLEHILS